MQRDHFIDFTEIQGLEGHLGIITLQRTSALNALTDPMVCDLYQKLKHWESTTSIKAIIVRAAPGRAFCAGGDIRSIYQKKLAQDATLGDFFRDEYRLNRLLFHFQKPYIALLDGITMGGGVGISIYGSHRIATENTSLAMPETGIGYFPDIGASYFLPRLPHFIGYYLGLTGERIAYQDCLPIGLVDLIIASKTQERLIQTLADTALPHHTAVTEIIQAFAVPAPQSSLWAHRHEIENCFSKPTLEEIIHALQSEKNPWCLKTVEILQTKSPASLKIALRALQEGSHLTFDACMEMEERLAKHFLHSHDFFEGIRAVLIDKDNKPRWEPGTLQEVTEAFVNHYFK